MPQFRFKIASDPRELEQIHALNYRTFVEEIPQHSPNSDGRLVDRFHDENVYAISLSGERVVGMLAIREQRPFSLDQKLGNIDDFLPAVRKPCEVRLLAVEKEHRTGPVLPGLLSVLWEHAHARQFDCAVISATTRQLKLYGHLGFVPFGQLVGTEEAAFQPMYITRERFLENARALQLAPAAREATVNLLTGPVALHADVAAALRRAPEGHRSQAFLADMDALRTSLRALTRAPHVAVLLGSGTLANDVVAAQLSRLDTRGLVVSNGEFGERLADQARRARLDCEHLRFDWSVPLDLDAIAKRDFDWLWMTACETSTAMLNDVAALGALCRARGAKLCLDAVSAIGAVPLDLSHVYLASGTSGKAFASAPGLALVFHDHDVEPAQELPRYLDLGLYVREDSVPFTHSSNLVRALRVAVERVDWPRRYAELASMGRWLRSRVAASGWRVLGKDAAAAPHVVTLALPPEVDAARFARVLEARGFLIGHASGYLRARNWIQLAWMGEVTRDDLQRALRELRRVS
ncbi:MAG: aminotransferase class V-fold PLP-dependent enzyme [Acidobacteria bacterium]|nr:aminotransferase class V-fold PLP-dependent enzyme [Acidobacteriota bacterium]MBV9477932.1 aminotransferase class V-fold PLP-dependent enzyme [Acidobacteriota bacterium]